MPIARGLSLAIMAVLVAGAACRAPVPTPTVTTTPAPATPPAAEVMRPAPPNVDLATTEVAAALDAARALREALRLAATDTTWARVTEACRVYPLGPVDPSFGVQLTQGLRSRSSQQALWPPQVASIDSAAATTCFVVASAAAIPPGSRVDPDGPTTAEIAAQPLQTALDDLRDASPQALRALIESQVRPGAAS